MANTILFRRGSTVPAAVNFTEGEPAWDSTNNALYVKNAAGTMVQVNGPSGGTFRLAAIGSAIGPTIADFFGANSAVNLAASSVYNIEYLAYLQKTTAGTLTWTLTASSAPTLITAMYWAGPVTGIAAGTPTTLYTGSRAALTAAFGATGSVSNNAFMAYHFKVQVITNLATNFRLRVTSSAGTVTPQAGSFYVVHRINSTSGSFAA